MKNREIFIARLTLFFIIISLLLSTNKSDKLFDHNTNDTILMLGVLGVPLVRLYWDRHLRTL